MSKSRVDQPTTPIACDPSGIRPARELTIGEYADLADDRRRCALIGHGSVFAAGLEALAWAVEYERTEGQFAPVTLFSEAPTVGSA